MSNRRKTIAVDFDGTLFTNNWPNIGEPKWDVINRVKAEQEMVLLLFYGHAEKVGDCMMQ